MWHFPPRFSPLFFILVKIKRLWKRGKKKDWLNLVFVVGYRNTSKAVFKTFLTFNIYSSKDHFSPVLSKFLGITCLGIAPIFFFLTFEVSMTHILLFHHVYHVTDLQSETLASSFQFWGVYDSNYLVLVSNNLGKTKKLSAQNFGSEMGIRRGLRVEKRVYGFTVKKSRSQMRLQTVGPLSDRNNTHYSQG